MPSMDPSVADLIAIIHWRPHYTLFDKFFGNIEQVIFSAKL